MKHSLNMLVLLQKDLGGKFGHGISWGFLVTLKKWRISWKSVFLILDAYCLEYRQMFTEIGKFSKSCVL